MYIRNHLSNYIEYPVEDLFKYIFDELLLLQYRMILSIKTIISYYLQKILFCLFFVIFLYPKAYNLVAILNSVFYSMTF